MSYPALFILMVLLIIIFGVLGTAIWAGFSAAPWVPTRKRDLARAFSLLSLSDADVFVDLGSGDGRMVKQAVKAGAGKARGVEISYFFVLLSRIFIAFSGVGKRAAIVRKSLWSADLSDATVIFCFLMPRAIVKLEKSLQDRVKPGTKIVSYAFHFPHLRLLQKNQPTPKDLPLYLYIV